jgi:hypothetical protein
MTSGFRLNRKGGAEVLKKLAAQRVNAVAHEIAAKAGPDAVVVEYTTDRAKAVVKVPAEQQARDGVLTRAAAAAGLEVKSK